MLTSLLTHALRMGSNINKSTSSENETISNFKFSKNVELRKKITITYSGMHCKRLVNPPLHVVDKHLIMMHLSISRHQKN